MSDKDPIEPPDGSGPGGGSSGFGAFLAFALLIVSWLVFPTLLFPILNRTNHGVMVLPTAVGAFALIPLVAWIFKRAGQPATARGLWIGFALLVGLFLLLLTICGGNLL